MNSDHVPSALALDPKTERIIKKIPGKIPPPAKDKSIFMGDLSKKSTADLRELLERQDKILNNKSLVNKLEDKGKRAIGLKRRIEQELKARDDVDKAANLLSEISLSQLNAFEWTGHCNPGHRNNKLINPHHPDHEETDPLKMIATHSGTNAQKKQITILKHEESLVRPEDVVDMAEPKQAISDNTKESSSTSATQSEEISNSNSESSKPLPQSSLRLDNPEPYAHFICERYGHMENKERFKLNKPLKPFDGTFPIKPPGRVSTKPKRWEETNVTPPVPVHGDSKLLSLEESIELQQKQNQKLREIQMKHAAEKLSALPGIHLPEQIPPNVLRSMAYRNNAENNSDSDDELNEADLEDQELHDEDQQDHGTTVVYNVES